MSSPADGGAVHSFIASTAGSHHGARTLTPNPFPGDGEGEMRNKLPRRPIPLTPFPGEGKGVTDSRLRDHAKLSWRIGNRPEERIPLAVTNLSFCSPFPFMGRGQGG